ncbi:MAG: helix-turn-helix transcriptional regulator [Oscillospiraceae bacterium]|nr:helix-turn-helix transcriptional regulator [Lachnospiraceae bacterium]MBQ7418364.1 helix-turn-helix transcriptional regulator [Acidaminococcaceae bacterium]MBQ9250231.1 helix-turn-helix transcriptional regulator [Oscillospiraceae bacterium]
MTATEIVKELMSIRKWSQSKLAEETGFKRQSNITGILNRGSSMRVDNLQKMVEAMGCELVVRAKDGSEREWKVNEVEQVE